MESETKKATQPPYPILESLAQILTALPPEAQQKLELVSVGMELANQKPIDKVTA